jgi:hypothetical protein
MKAGKLILYANTALPLSDLGHLLLKPVIFLWDKNKNHGYVKPYMTFDRSGYTWKL